MFNVDPSQVSGFNVLSYAAPIEAARQQEYRNALSNMGDMSPAGNASAQYNALQTYGGPTKAAAGDVDMRQRIYSGLVDRGLPPHVAEGFVLNMQDESGLNPGINEQNPIVAGSRGGYGLYQLTGPRRRAYEAYASQSGAPLDSVDAQLDFLVSELQGPESRAARSIFSTTTPGAAATAIVNDFLRPAEEHRQSRAARYAGYQGDMGAGQQQATTDDLLAYLGL